MSTQIPHIVGALHLQPPTRCRTTQSSDPNLAQSLSIPPSSSTFPEVMDGNAVPSTPPRTPQRIDAGHRNSRAQTVSESASKPPKSKGKNRPKNLSTTATTPAQQRHSPPLTGHQNVPTSARAINTPVVAAYAGPTFHASPAPSALPMPTFFSKSVPDSPALMRRPAAAHLEISSDHEQSPTRPSARIIASEEPRQESPLDFIFNAHRQESARARSATGSGKINGTFNLPVQPSAIQQITPVPLVQKRLSRGYGSGSKMFTGELDGSNSPGKPIGEAFATPYAQRMAEAAGGRIITPPRGQLNDGPPSPLLDKAQALKDLLFIGASSPGQDPSRSPRGVGFADVPKQIPGSRTTSAPLGRNVRSNQHLEHAHNTIPRAGTKQSGLRQEFDLRENNRTRTGAPMDSPTRIPPSPAPSDVQSMEESLRRILKLTPSTGVHLD